MTIELVGWALVHSVWQGGAIAAALGVILRVSHRASATTRYAIAAVALGLTVVAPVATSVARRRPADVASTSAMPLIAAPAANAPQANATRTTAELRQTPSRSYVSSLGMVAVQVQRALPWIVGTWIAGLLLLSLRLLGGVVRAQRFTRVGVVPVTQRVAAMARVIAARLGISAAIRVLESTRIDVPVVVGWFEPVVLIPASLLTGLAPFQLEMLLAHELAHIRRYDTIVNLAQTLVETLLFFHPAVWWISNRVREEREDCCDDLALAATGGDRATYGATLLLLEERRGLTPAFATAAAGGSLLRRVRRIAGRGPAPTELGPRWLAGVIGVLAVWMVAGTANARVTPVRDDARMDLSPRVVQPNVLPSTVSVSSSAPVRATHSAPASAARDTLHRIPKMRHASILASAAALTLASASLVAQPKPNFSGKWLLVPDSAVAAILSDQRPVLNGWSVNPTITQDDKTLTFAYTSPKGEIKMVYGLDGSERDLVALGADGNPLVIDGALGAGDARSRAVWDGDKLVINMTASGAGAGIALTMTLSLDAGGHLIVEGRIGESAGLPAATMTVRYKRATAVGQTDPKWQTHFKFGQIF